MATPRPVAAFCSAADAVLTPFFLLISVAAPLIDAQTVLPGCLFPRFLSNLKSWYADINGDYLMRDHPGFFVGLVWLEIAVQWPLAVANAYAVTVGRRRCRWYPTTCLLYGASTASGMAAIVGELVMSGRGTKELMMVYLPFMFVSVLSVLRGLVSCSSSSSSSIDDGSPKED
ncbi:hypothetical protein QJS04_geneDACA018081 [Acorus gramineus]|uniref:EXPERA domain-containing protein n=1 Tax=Acorus gramineus TaxID=55184 RepID=A0AAV9A9N0_ACOGR|nr:hypothetical protein QJS04_geneDACA018081 [Acorus gramineus]